MPPENENTSDGATTAAVADNISAPAPTGPASEDLQDVLDYLQTLAPAATCEVPKGNWHSYNVECVPASDAARNPKVGDIVLTRAIETSEHITKGDFVLVVIRRTSLPLVVGFKSTDDVKQYDNIGDKQRETIDAERNRD